MLRKSFVFLTFLVSACVSSTERFCPNINIPRDTSYLTQKVNYSEEFQIEIKGYEGYCFVDPRVNRQKAVITPIFIIKKLTPTDETDIDFSYFLKPQTGPKAYLAKQNFNEHVTMQKGSLEMEYVGKDVIIKIPNEDAENFEITMGLNSSREEKKYNNRTFDLEYRYYEPEADDYIDPELNLRREKKSGIEELRLVTTKKTITRERNIVGYAPDDNKGRAIVSRGVAREEKKQEAPKKSESCNSCSLWGE